MIKGTIIGDVLRGLAPIPPELPKEDMPYFAGLGRFIVEYAAAEATVHLLARQFSGLSDAKARAIFSGMRLKDMVERIRQMMRLDSVSEDTIKEVDHCLVHLDEIADRRHKLVHRQVRYQAGALSVSNWLTAKSVSHAEQDSYDLGTLNDMRIDCLAINIRLRDVAYPDQRERPPELDAFLRRAWRYKPSRPDKKPKPPRKAPRSRKRQPPSSR